MQYKKFTVQTFERDLGKWRASVRRTDGRLLWKGRARIPQFRDRYRCNDTAARITDGACGHRPRCFLATISGSQDAARASSQKRKLVPPSIKEQHHQVRHQHSAHHSGYREHAYLGFHSGPLFRRAEVPDVIKTLLRKPFHRVTRPMPGVPCLTSRSALSGVASVRYPGLDPAVPPAST